MAQYWAEELARNTNCDDEIYHNPELPSWHYENIYWEYPSITAKAALNWWKNSSPHRRNVIITWQEVLA